MNARQAASLLFAGAVWLSVPHPADAYRPFVGTDAAVAERGKAEIEFGPAQFLRESRQRTLFEPSAVFNYGFAPDWEFVAEGQAIHALSGTPSGTAFGDDAMSVKRMLRRGSLQDEPGPSIATEFGLLLPGIREDRGTGATLSGILSQQWEWATVHVNTAVTLTRQQHADLFAGCIVEGPHDWTVRPVVEIFGEHEFGGSAVRSALIGAIWQTADDLAFDIAVRGARDGQHDVAEIRAGVTFAFAVR
jgi:hypothetical protein